MNALYNEKRDQGVKCRRGLFELTDANLTSHSRKHRFVPEYSQGFNACCNRMKTQIAAEDLILQRPSLIHSSAVQICVSGMVIALNFILLLHLLFTAMYHFPLSRTNFSLLTISVLALLTGTAVDLALTMSNLQSRSSALYPFSFDYTSVKLPTSERTSVLIFYWTLQAIVAAFANMTHVQMLTLLYSAKPEKLAICILLLPLVILSGVTGFLNLSNSSRVVYIGSAMSDVTQAVLTLVYNIGLLTWGLGLHRRSAWKVDGGTAGFGLVTCILALFNTVISFIIIRADLYWLINVQLALVVWQSWTAFWWWVGSGVSEVCSQPW